MTQAEIETVYDALAAAIDGAGAGKSELFLAKLALLLSRRLGDATAVLDCIAEARRHLED
ncbi:DUF2783 domain-containing protein [Actibacterium sp. MT2.3-13A]|uniref:DUF2783 domain-containing protein n=1 Tax=Actibacterium sp. MT2.3-13A TaxID=2828332 RepID=UPI001BA596DE|nr:DUF2783 domain-containing protein [Actibacterium sp. MT2.3-13A]